MKELLKPRYILVLFILVTAILTVYLGYRLLQYAYSSAPSTPTFPAAQMGSAAAPANVETPYVSECPGDDLDPQAAALPLADTLRYEDTEIKVYKVICGYASESFTYDIYRDGQRVRFYSGIVNPYPDSTPINLDNGLLYLRNESKSFIYDISLDKEFEIDGELPCNNLRAAWYDKYLLLTGIKDYPNGISMTDNCVFSSEGQKLHELTSELEFLAVAPGYAIKDHFGLKVEDASIWFYRNSEWRPL